MKALNFRLFIMPTPESTHLLFYRKTPLARRLEGTKFRLQVTKRFTERYMIRLNSLRPPIPKLRGLSRRDQWSTYCSAIWRDVCLLSMQSFVRS